MARVSHFNVALPPALSNFVKKKARHGQFGSEADVIREGIRMMKDQDQTIDRFWQDLRNKVQLARRQAKAGEVVDGEDAMAEIIDNLKPAKPTLRKR